LSKYKIFAVIIGYVLLNFSFIGALIMFQNIMIRVFILACFLIIQVVSSVYVLAVIRDLTSLIEATRHRAAGNTDYPIEVDKYKIAFHSFANDLNELQDGLQLALDDAIRGEKMKTELITNVSHDLKNPLTSIITYLDLLEKSLDMYKDPDRSLQDKDEIEENMENYIQILSNKGYRLKTLIEDLVSASKASSGNLAVELMDINLRQMLVQLMADREEYFGKANLSVVFSPEYSEPVWALVDPNHMYRVFENIISNIIKYSLTGTRVFVEIESVGESVHIVFKNVSNHPLDIDGSNLSARFVRGDGSRSSEGSGLGLSITESLVKLQDGKQEIVVDGDMFKVVLDLPGGENPMDALVLSEKQHIDVQIEDSEDGRIVHEKVMLKENEV